jgi:hypothetical protein
MRNWGFSFPWPRIKEGRFYVVLDLTFFSSRFETKSKFIITQKIFGLFSVFSLTLFGIYNAISARNSKNKETSMFNLIFIFSSCCKSTLKGQYHKIFDPRFFFHQSNPPRPLTNGLKPFRICLRIR